MNSQAIIRWGATPDDWCLLADVAGLTADLLPVVSNPGARIDTETSKLKQLGKVPSLYNARGMAVGIGKWTEKVSKAADIDRWMTEGDYGICVQTRVVRALDIDVDNQEMVDAIRLIAERHLGALPERVRADSPKCLLAFTLPGQFTKRILKTAHGNIEFLATGQQFVAVGTHPKGSRYEWVDGTPMDFPTVSVEAFEACWAELTAQFATEEVIEIGAARQLREVRRAVNVQDDVADYLIDKGYVRSETRDGRLNIVCPFEHEHSGPSADDTATQYFPKGVGGFEMGHFHCLHAHCAKRSDADYIDAIGYMLEQFDVVPVSAQDAANEAVVPPFDRNLETGKPLVTIANVMRALRAPEWLGYQVARDEFRDELMLTVSGRREWRPFIDADYTRLRLRMADLGLAAGLELIKEGVLLAGEEHRFDSAIMWLKEEVPAWDGVPRIDTFYPRVFGTEDTPYTRAVGAYTWTALAGRVLDPGCKVDMVPILQGGQGLGKSTAVAAMAPSHEFFCELDLGERDDNKSRMMRGCLVAELGELKGLNSSEEEAIKAFIVRRFEKWVPKYREFSVTFPRRLLFIGTTNRHEFLADDTGNRRWLPMVVTKADPELVAAERLQLWAEGRERWRSTGVEFRQAERLAEAEHDQFRLVDPWEHAIRGWLEQDADFDVGTKNGQRELHTHDVLVGALRFEPRQVRRADEMRVAKVLKALGYTHTTLPPSLGRRRVWRRSA